MAVHNILIPKMGESITEATITKWHKKKGESVLEDEAILEIATDKVDSEIASPVNGILQEIFFEEGSIVEVGKLVAIIATDGEIVNTETIIQIDTTTITEEYKSDIEIINETNSVETKDRFFSPLVKSIAKQEEISNNELELISGTGKDGRITKIDLLNYIENKRNHKISSEKIKKEHIEIPKLDIAININSSDEIIEMDRMRKLIADHMVKSKHTSPHVTSFMEIDVTNLVLWRNRVKDEFEKREHEKITLTPIFIEAVAKAIKDFPMINTSTDGTKVYLKKNINIGMATALPTGNLIVPVIKNADRLNLIGLTKNVNDLANRARSNKLFPEDIQDGTFTITNLGTFGTDFGTPIINQPQSAILAIGAIKKKPVVIETPTGDSIGIRQMMYLSLAYDHRIIDGALGGYFLKTVGKYLSEFDINRDL